MNPAPTAMEVGPGTVIAETYRIERRLGEGGMGVVFEAQHLRVPKRVAVKVLRSHPDGDQVARFRQEAEVTSRLQHDGIVDIIDFNTLPSGAAYIVMELLAGESLAHRMRDRSQMPVADVVPLLRQIASALHAAHCAGVVHRDLKPENVFLIKREQDGVYVDQVKLLDFGISKVHGSSVVRTAEDVVLGTPRYMAPEQALGFNDDVDPRCDQFALAVIAYEMLSGNVPFTATNTTQVMFQIAYEAPPPLSEVAPHVPPAMVATIERAMSKQPGARFADLSQFVKELTGRPLAEADRSSYPVLSAAKIPEPPNRSHVTVPSKPRPKVGDTAGAPTQPEVPTVNERPSQPSGDAQPFQFERLGTGPVAPVASAPSRPSKLPFVLIGAAAMIGTAAIVIALNKSEPKKNDIVAAVQDAGTLGSSMVVDAPSPDAYVAAAPVLIDAGVVADAAVRIDAGTMVKRDPHKPIPAEAAEVLAEAEQALEGNDLGEADRAARRALRYGTIARAYEILVEVSCANRDLPAVHGWLRNLPPSTWPRMHARCRVRGFESTNP